MAGLRQRRQRNRLQGCQALANFAYHPTVPGATTFLSAFLAYLASIQGSAANRLLDSVVKQSVAEYACGWTQGNSHCGSVTTQTEAWQELAQQDNKETKLCPLSMHDVQFSSEVMETSIQAQQLLNSLVPYRMIDLSSSFHWRWGMKVWQKQ
jgi:hypothetical protein